MTEGEADGRSLGDNVEPTCLQASLGRSHSAIGLQRSLCRAYAVLGDGIGISDGRADGTNVGLHSRTLALINCNAIRQSSLAPAGRRRGGTARLLRYRQHCRAAHTAFTGGGDGATESANLLPRGRKLRREIRWCKGWKICGRGRWAHRGAATQIGRWHEMPASPSNHASARQQHHKPTCSIARFIWSTPNRNACRTLVKGG